MDRLFLVLGSLLAGLAVALGAFGAHALRDRLGADLLNTFEIAVRYQMYHALALLAVGLVLARFSSSNLVPISGWLFLAGIVLFSGSLYLLCFTGVRWLGAITPLGGVAFILGWLLLAMGVWRG